jgi:hypothetical protein
MTRRRSRRGRTARQMSPAHAVTYRDGSPGLAAEVAAAETRPVRLITDGQGTGDTLENFADHEPTVVLPPPAPERCGCGFPSCPDTGWLSAAMPGGDPRAMLSYAPGVTSRMSLERVRNGQYEDVAAAADDAWARVHNTARKRGRAIRRGVTSARQQVAAVFAATPGLLSDPDLAEGLHRMEAEMPGRMAELQDWVARRAAEYRREADAEGWAA